MDPFPCSFAGMTIGSISHPLAALLLTRQNATTVREEAMERVAESPLATYQAHLEKGELAYQWSPEAQRAVFYPRVICPFTGSDRLEWRVSAGLGTVYATTVVHPAREG
ncbi:MAG TPA: hypothetical protein VJX94_04120, partial [Stellaceae bacterium]|nr:hypothetical protein [Stellaceae bacterium]